jgi:hypothetical protein
LTREEARYMKLPEGSGMFSELFNSMAYDIKTHPEKEKDYKEALYMKDYEKDISFLNRYFIFKKTSTRNAEKLTKSLLDELPYQEDIEQTGTLLARKVVQEAQEIVKPKTKKLREKLKLQEATEALEETKDVEDAKGEVKEFEEVIEISVNPKKKRTRKNI